MKIQTLINRNSDQQLTWQLCIKHKLLYISLFLCCFQVQSIDVILPKGNPYITFEAILLNSCGIVVDNKDSLFVYDTENHVFRKYLANVITLPVFGRKLHSSPSVDSRTLQFATITDLTVAAHTPNFTQLKKSIISSIQSLKLSYVWLIRKFYLLKIIGGVDLKNTTEESSYLLLDI